jgi:phosphomannomutase/phosphoglucomutase
VIFSRGDTELAAEASENSAQVGDSDLFVAVSVPKAMRVLDYGVSTVLALGAGGFLLGLVLLWMARKPVRESDFAEPDLSFAQALEQVEATLPRKAERPAKPVKNEVLPDARLVDRSIFRAYDIRGVVGQTLNVAIAELIGQAIGSSMQEQGLREVVVGRDGRLSGPDLADALSSGLRRAGCDVIDIGVVPTPLVYFGTFHLGTGCGVAVTGSHNPPEYNGFKIMIGGETLSGDAIADLYARIAEDRLLLADSLGGLQQTDLAGDYIERVSGDIQLERRMKVVVDAGNGAAGELAAPLLESIGCEVLPLYCDIDGSFPNHHPDPSDPRNLTDLITTVQRMGAELGIALDGDGDRIGVVTRKGEIIYPDRVLMLFAQDVLGRNPGASVIYDVKCTGHLVNHILRHGGSPIMWKSGHSLIKAKMKETDAELAGEMSGHFFFRERWFGFDDGLYAAARLLEIIASDGREPEEIFDEIPAGVGTPELKLPMVEGEHHRFVERFRDKAQFEGAKISTIDGLRVDWPDGWGLVRASNTTPALVMRFDADSNAALERIQKVFREQLLALDDSLQLPF